MLNCCDFARTGNSRVLDFDAQYTAIHFLHQPANPKKPRALSNNGKPAGMGTTVALPLASTLMLMYFVSFGAMVKSIFILPLRDGGFDPKLQSAGCGSQAALPSLITAVLRSGTEVVPEIRTSVLHLIHGGPHTCPCSSHQLCSNQHNLPNRPIRHENAGCGLVSSLADGAFSYGRR